MRKSSGQVAQVVERSPEKAGVGGSTPSLATILFNTYAFPFQTTWVQLGAKSSAGIRLSDFDRAALTLSIREFKC
jgi:hypothetical protein